MLSERGGSAYTHPKEVTPTVVTVISGANEAVADLAGQTVRQVRASFAQALNIAQGASASVNGRAADDDQELQENDRLVFAQALAEKGR